MNQNRIFIQTQKFAPSFVQSTLREGDSVFVRILSKDNSNTYTAYFSGARFTVTSERDLSPGTTFTAVISYKDGKIFLTPKLSESSILHSFIEPKLPLSSASELSNTKIASYLSSLGISPDVISFQLFQMIKQLGLRINIPLIRRAAKIASKFSGRENEAAQVALLLGEKGIEPTEENIRCVLETFLGGYSENDELDSDSFSEKGKNGEQPDNSTLLKDLVSELKEYFNKILAGNFSNKTGLLTLFNQTGYRDYVKGGIKEHWIILPYELERRNGIKMHGSIKILLDPELKRTVKVVIFTQIVLKKYFFVLFYDNRVLRKVYFSQDPMPLKKNIRSMERELKSLLHTMQSFNREIQIKYTSSDALAGFNVENVPVTVVRGNV